MSDTTLSLFRRRQVIDALRFGAVPPRGLEHIATGLHRFAGAIDGDLDMVLAGEGRLKAIRGEYGTGKTFFARWLEHRAQQRGFATSLVQISPAEAPLHRFELVYRAAIAAMTTKEFHEGAFRSVLDAWFFHLENEAAERGLARADDAPGLARAVGTLLDQRLRMASLVQPRFANALRAAYEHRVRGDTATEEGLIAWVMGQPNVGVAVKNAADVRGEIDATVASGFLRGVLEVLRQTQRHGLVLVLDEVETIQRIRTDQRERALGELRRLVDELFAGRFPGLYLVITGTTKFFEGPQGIKMSPALEQRLATQFGPDPRFDSTRAPQIRLTPFDFDRLVEVGRKVHALYPARNAARIAKVDDAMLRALANNVRGALGGKLGIAPRVYLRKLVQLLDTLDEHADFDPIEHGGLTVSADEAALELSSQAHEDASSQPAAAAMTAADVSLDLDGSWDARGDGTEGADE
jgi:hypothetical protein